MRQFDFDSLSRVNPKAIQCSAEIREKEDYFQVFEQLPFEPDGSGGHVWLKIQKRGINTDWLASELAKFSGVAPVAVGYAGLKDRHAITQQWFSVNLEGHDEPDWSQFETADITVIEQARHGKKLKRGVLSGNQFILRLTGLKGDKTLWQQALETIQQQGVPNYFGEQRFGHHGSNLNRANHWFETGKAPKKRNQKSIYLSAARSWLFNLVLSKRIDDENWNKAITGDSLLLAGTKASLFNAEQLDQVIEKRVQSMDVHPTGVMWGRGQPLNKALSMQLEQDILSEWQDWQHGLEKAGLSQERRSLRLFPADFNWAFLGNEQLEISFSLPAGSYATVIMRELAVITDAQHRNYQRSNTITPNTSDRQG